MKQIAHSNDQRQRIVASINSQDLPLSVEWRPYKSKRSLGQNALFHKWMEIVSRQHAENTGTFYHAEMWKVFFKEMYLGYEEVEIMGKLIRRLKGTSDGDTKTMSDFMSNVDHYCGSELQIFLPSPGMPEEIT